MIFKDSLRSQYFISHIEKEVKDLFIFIRDIPDFCHLTHSFIENFIEKLGIELDQILLPTICFEIFKSKKTLVGNTAKQRYENFFINPSKMYSKEKIRNAAEKGGFISVANKLPLKFDTLLGKEFGGTTLSGGEWQKLAMSRAFMKDANILVLDEPTSSLDPRSEYEVFQKFSDNSENRTTIFVTHRMGSVLIADRIIVMKKGSIVEQGNHEMLMKAHGDYASLFKMQSSRFESSSKLQIVEKQI